MRVCVHLETSTLVQQQRRCLNTRSNAKNCYFNQKKGNDMFKLGCTLPNLANMCLHKSTSAKFYQFTETDKDCCKRFQKI